MALATPIYMPEHSVVLLAEDEEDYVLLIRKAFEKAKIPNPLHVVSDGQQAMAYLQGEGKYSNRDEYPLPDLLLLDMRLPRFSGLEVLKWVRSDAGLCGLRVIVLTSSDRIKDVNEAYRLGANSFLVKPYDFVDLVRLTTLIKDLWLYQSECPESFRPPKKAAQPESSTASGAQSEKKS